MKTQVLTASIAVSFLLSACSRQTTPVVTHKSTSRSITTLDYSLNALLWQQYSGEYKALCYQAFALARMQLQDTLRKSPATGKPLAIVTDIDETILDNSPQQAHDLLKHTTYTEKSWKTWTTLASAKPLPGAVAFFQFAAQNGVEIYYISNRSQSELAATLRNMQNAGFPQADEQHVQMKAESSDKEPRRKAVAQTHRIVLLLGDNLNDFDSIFYQQNASQRNQLVTDTQKLFGTRFIILPNTIYGDWESALWRGQTLTPKQADVLKRKALLTF